MKVLLLAFKTPESAKVDYVEELSKKLECISHDWDDLELHDGTPTIGGEKLDQFDYVLIGPIHSNEPKYSAMIDWLKNNDRKFLSYGHPPSKNNKLLQTAKLSDAKLPQPKTIIACAGVVKAEDLITKLNLPIVSKITDGSQGKGIEKHDNQESLSARLERDAGQTLIFQEFIKNEGDYRVFFLKDKQLYAILRKSMSVDEFRNNVSLGGSYEQVDLPEQAIDIAAAAVEAMGFDVTGVDLINRKGTEDWYVLEVNAAPQFSLPEIVLPAMADLILSSDPENVPDEGPQAELLIITAEPKNFVPVELQKAAKAQKIEAKLVDERELLIVEGGSTDAATNGYVAILEDDKLVKLEITPNTVVIPRLNEHHLEFKLGVMRRLESLGAKLLNSADSMSLCNDKLASQIVLNGAGIHTPWSFMLQKMEQVEPTVIALEETGKLKFPAIIKTLRGTHGIGVMKLESRGSFVSVAQALIKEGIDFMGQEFCEHEQSIRVIMLGEELLAANVRGQPKDKDEFRTNSHLGSETEHYDPTDDELEMGRKIVKLFGCNFCAIDFIIIGEGEDRKVVVLEVNGSPGLEAIQKDWPDKNLASEVVKYARKLVSAPEVTEPAKQETVANSTVNSTLKCLITRIMSEPVEARVDTGAGLSSLHAEEVSVDETNSTVTFTYDGTRYRAPYSRVVKIKNNHGGESKARAAIMLNIEINGESKNIEFTLRDREHMKYNVLLGRNAIGAFGLNVSIGDIKQPDGSEEVEEVEEE